MYVSLCVLRKHTLIQSSVFAELHDCSNLQEILHDGKLFVEQVRTSTRTPLVSVLIHGKFTSTHYFTPRPRPQPKVIYLLRRSSQFGKDSIGCIYRPSIRLSFHQAYCA